MDVSSINVERTIGWRNLNEMDTECLSLHAYSINVCDMNIIYRIFLILAPFNPIFIINEKSQNVLHCHSEAWDSGWIIGDRNWISWMRMRIKFHEFSSNRRQLLLDTKCFGSQLNWVVNSCHLRAVFRCSDLTEPIINIYILIYIWSATTIMSNALTLHLIV